jgi:DNA-binding MarR family transcriptional regulator
MEIDRAPERLRTLPSWLLAQSSNVVRRFVSAELAALDVGRGHYALLACLDEFGPLSQADLGAHAGLDRGDVVRHVDGLAAASLVARSVDPTDRRRNIITLTDPGRRRLRELDTALARAQDDALARLTPDERQQLVTLLRRLLDPPGPASVIAKDSVSTESPNPSRS